MTIKQALNNNVLLLNKENTADKVFLDVPKLLPQKYNYVIWDIDKKKREGLSNYFKKHGYNIKILDLENIELTNYNPLKNITHNFQGESNYEFSVFMETYNMIENTSHSDPFIQVNQNGILQTIILYTALFNNENENLNEVFKLLQNIMGEKYNEQLYSYIQEIHSKGFGTTNIDNYLRKIEFINKSKAEGKDVSHLTNLDKCSFIVHLINLKEICEMFGQSINNDEMNIENISDEKTVIFITPSKENQIINFMANILFMQIFIKVRIFRGKTNPRAEYPVKFLFNDFEKLDEIIKILKYYK